MTIQKSFSYPATPEVDERVSTGGVEFNDVYRWLAEDNPATLQWQQAQDELAQVALAAGGGVQRFEALLEPVFADMYNFHAPMPMAGRWFHRPTPPGEGRLPVIQVSDTPDGPARVIFDVASLGSPVALLHHVVPSPDGSQVIVVAPLNDAEHTLATVVVETATGAVLHRFTDHGHMWAPVWLPDNAGFVSTAAPSAPLPEGFPVAPGMRVFEQLFDAGHTRRYVPLAHAHPMVTIAASDDRSHLIVSESQVSTHPTWIRRLEAGAGWEPFLDASYGRVRGTVIGADYVAVHCDDESPTGRLVAIPLASPRDRASWRVLKPAGETTLSSVTPLDGRLVVCEFREGFSCLQVLRRDGGVEREIALPAPGAIGRFALGFIGSNLYDPVWSDGDHQMSFVFSSPRHAPASYRYDVRSDQLQALGAPARVLHKADLTTLETRAADGARVVYQVLSSRHAATPLPTIVTGYGGFNAPWLACWSALGAAWVEAGGTWVHTHLRGGGEFGQAFWQAGRMAQKANTFEDLYAVLRDLVRRGVSTAGQLGIFGTSNGGVLVCAAVSQQPELFAAGVAQVPATDVHDVVRDPLPFSICAVEYGNPLVPEEAAWLTTWSPYRTLRRGTRFPAVMLDASANDYTCPSWHSRKFAAFLQNHGDADSGQVLLRVRADAGHNEMTRAQFIRRDAEELAFMAQHLGLKS